MFAKLLRHQAFASAKPRKASKLRETQNAWIAFINALGNDPSTTSSLELGRGYF
ncbi:hypothetical protein ACS3SW_00095 [Roseobacteraceae bacterium S113]